MRSVLVGAVESTAVTLRTMVQQGHTPSAVITLPLALQSRHSDFVDLRPLAGKYQVPVIEAANVNEPESLMGLRRLEPELVWVVGWSQICGLSFLETPSVGCIGFHPALLPENRGRAVIPWTILQEAEVTGSTLFWLSEGMDDGDIICQEEFPVALDETAESLCQKHAASLERMVRSVVDIKDPADIPSTKQDHVRATYCARRTAEDGLINWDLPAREIWRFIRAVGRPYPGAFTFLRGARVTIWAADYAGESPIWAQAGQVVQADVQTYLVQCGDRRHIKVHAQEIELDDPTVRVAVGQKFSDARKE